jgi:RecB family exonuclease
MTVTRVFTGWDRPLLHTTTEFVRDRYLRDGQLDLRRVVLAVPGARAGRRLLELLVALADERSAILLPPRIVTVGALPEVLFDDASRTAEALVRNIAWVEALRACGPDALRPVLIETPRDDDWLGWSLLGEVIDALHVELAGHELDFRSVAQRGLALETFDDAPRWMSLASAQEEYTRALTRFGFADPQARRARAIEQGRSRFDGELVLVGLAELTPLTRRLVDIASELASVTALVHAPDSHAGGFDAHGCIVAAHWSEHRLDIASDQLDIVDRPADQAIATIRALARLEGRFPAQDIVVGIPDEQLVPHLEQQLGAVGLPIRAAQGTPLSTTRTLRLLAAVADYLEHGRVRDFAVLVRHPDVEQALRGANRSLAKADYLTALDGYLTDRVPAVLPTTWIPDERERDKWRAPLLDILRRAVDPMLGPLRSGPRPLHRWARPVLDVDVAMNSGDTLDPRNERDRVVLEACAAIRDLFDLLEPIPATAIPSVSAAVAIRWIERQLARVPIPPSGEEPAIELLGWLELPLDDTPVLVVTGMNEGIVPESVNADQFLPNALRRHLGLVDNDQRHARDVYALQRMLASRERVQLVTARRSAEGDPLAPSRLLLACEPAVLTQRVRAFYREDPDAPIVTTRGRFQPSVLHSEFPIPRPKTPEAPFDVLRVTQFRDYLACPYRFYLKHGLQLDGLDDVAVELDAARFGTLAHAVLEAFGKHEARHEPDVRVLRATLDALLDRIAAKSYGNDAGPAVLVQIEQLRVRLREFAAWQADWMNQGWRILEVESKLIDARLETDGVAIPIHGRLDRIDINPSTGEWIVFDYKTSDTAKSPESAHRKKGEWVDLQLPLYRHLAPALACAPRAREMGAHGPPRVAYLQLPKTGSGVRAVQPRWIDEDFASAIACAHNIVRKIRKNVFWPPKYPPPPFSEVYARITRDGQLGAEAAIETTEPPAEETA